MSQHWRHIQLLKKCIIYKEGETRQVRDICNIAACNKNLLCTLVKILLCIAFQHSPPTEEIYFSASTGALQAEGPSSVAKWE